MVQLLNHAARRGSILNFNNLVDFSQAQGVKRPLLVFRRTDSTLDLLNWYCGSRPVMVSASLHNRAHSLIKVEDSAEGYIKYDNGINASFFAINYYGYDAPVELELFCEKGIVKLVGEKATITFNDGRVFSQDRDPSKFFEFKNAKQYWGVGHMMEISEFYSCLEKHMKPRNTADEVLSTHRLIDSIYKSGKTGENVYLNWD